MAASLTVTLHAVYHFALSADLTMAKPRASMLSGTANILTKPKAMREIAVLTPGAGHIIPAEAHDGLSHPPARRPKEATQ